MSASPCIRVCRVSPDGRTCTGCGRTLDEIAKWSTLSADARAAIVKRLGLRARREARDSLR